MKEVDIYSRLGLVSKLEHDPAGFHVPVFVIDETRSILDYCVPDRSPRFLPVAWRPWIAMILGTVIRRTDDILCARENETASDDKLHFLFNPI